MYGTGVPLPIDTVTDNAYSFETHHPCTDDCFLCVGSAYKVPLSEVVNAACDYCHISDNQLSHDFFMKFKNRIETTT